jgi:hypothetical protein
MKDDSMKSQATQWKDGKQHQIPELNLPKQQGNSQLI